MNRNDSQGLAIVARPDKSLNRHFVATSQLAPPGSAVGTALGVQCNVMYKVSSEKMAEYKIYSKIQKNNDKRQNVI